MPSNGTEIIQTRVAKIWVGEHHIILMQLLPNLTESSIMDVEELSDALKTLKPDGKVHLLLDARQHKRGITNSATRDAITTGEFATVVDAFAIVFSSPVIAMLGNFFIRINRPPYPVKLFTRKAEAVEWLQSFQ